MSRVGRAPVFFDDKTQVSVNAANEVLVKGAKAQMIVKMLPTVKAEIEGKKLTLVRSSETKEVRSLHGLYRALIQNAVTGVSKGFTKGLELHGVGYRASVSGKKLELS